jgi:hypothetical protein
MPNQRINIVRYVTDCITVKLGNCQHATAANELTRRDLHKKHESRLLAADVSMI